MARVGARTFFAAIATAAVAAAPAFATPVASTEAERAQLGRTFPEPLNSTDFINFGPQFGPEELKAGWSLNEKLFPQYVDFTTVAEELGDPNAVSAGNSDGLPPWDPNDTKDGLPLYVVKVTDESVPDKDKQYVLFVNAHAAEPCGTEGTPRFLEDLLIWRTTDPNRLLDDGTGISGIKHEITVAELLKRTKLYWVNVAPDGWAIGDGHGRDGANYNGAGANSNRVAYQDGWVFPPHPKLIQEGYSVLQQPEGAAVTKYLRRVREVEMGGRPWAVSNDQHGPLPVGAVLMHDQGNTAAKVDRTEDYAARTSEKMDEVFAAYATQTGLTVTQAAAAEAGSVRDELFRLYTAATGNPVTEKAAFLTLEWAEYASIWEHLDYNVSGTWGGWAGSTSGLGADAISFEVDCAAYGDWQPALYQLFVDNVRAINETAAVHAAAKTQGVAPVRTYDLDGPIGFVETGTRITDRDGNPSPPPPNFPGNPLVSFIPQTHYDVANTDYFRDLRPIVGQPVVEVPARSPARLGESVASMVVSDTTATDTAVLRAFAQDGGNLVLTDGALQLLPDLIGVPKESIKQGFAYVGYSDLDRAHPWTQGLYKRARQMFDPVGLGYPLLMERDQYWPCSEDGVCEPSPTENSAPIWTVDRAAWTAKGGTTIGTADPPADRHFGGEGTATDKTTIGTLKLGKGRVVLFGALLPRPTEQFEHWFGLNPYTISVPGQQMLMRALKFKRDGLKPLPAAARPCTSARALTIRLPKNLRSARVTLKGKRQKVLRGRRLRARLNLRRLPAGRHTVRIVGRTKGGRKVKLTRRVHTCGPAQ